MALNELLEDFNIHLCAKYAIHLLIIHVLIYIKKSIALHTNIYLLAFSCSLLFFHVLYITLKSATNGLCNFEFRSQHLCDMYFVLVVTDTLSKEVSMVYCS